MTLRLGHGVRIGLLAAAFAGTITTAQAAVLCARVRGDGTYSGSVKIRAACKTREVQLAPEDVGFCCGTAATTTTGPTPTSTPTPTTSPTPTTTAASTTLPVTTTTTVASVCGNNVIEPGEVCDCGIPPCEPVRYGPVTGLNQGGCPNGPGASATYCASDCSACLPAPRCGNGIMEPGDSCDWLGGSNGDNCGPGSICQDTVPCECTCASSGQFCLQHTPCCPGFTCVNSVCQ